MSPHEAEHAARLATKVMAVVPFRVSGAAADQSLEQRLFQIGPYTLFIKQNPKVNPFNTSSIPEFALSTMGCIPGTPSRRHCIHLPPPALDFTSSHHYKNLAARLAESQAETCFLL